MSNDNILDKVIKSANENELETEKEEKDLSKMPKRDTVKIHSGDAISEDSINNYFSADFIKLIILAGLPGHGKTTLISSIYDKFIQDGMYGNFEFTGSKTIIGYEKRSYLSRLRNGQSTNTRRTILGEDNPYLDLTLTNQENKEKKRIMFVDTSGEVFQNFQKKNDSIMSFNSLPRANHFSYIFDISQFNDPGKKHLAKDTAKTIIRSIKDQNMFSPNVNIEIVFSKWDKIVDNEILQSYKNSIIDDINAIFPLMNVKHFVVNSVSDSNSFQLLDLFNHWMNTPCVHDYVSKQKSENINWANDYNKFLDDGEQ